MAQEQDEGENLAEIENEKMSALFEKLAQKLAKKEKELEEKMEALAQEQDLQEDVGTEQDEAMEQDHDEKWKGIREADKKEMVFSEAEEDDDAALQELIDQMRESLDDVYNYSIVSTDIILHPNCMVHSSYIWRWGAWA